MTPTLVFDLETIPDIAGLRALQGAGPEVSDESVYEFAVTKRREVTGNVFLPLHLQRIAVVGCIFRDENGFRVKCLGQADDPEENLISAFFKTIDRYTPKLVSWNGSGFDLPVLHYRSLIHGLVAQRYWDTGDDDREFRYSNYISRYHNRHVDLMDVLAKYNGRGNAPLDEIAKLCGFPGKLGMDGSQVWPAWQAGKADEIRAYCETDVMNTWLVYCRFRQLRGEIDATEYKQEIELVREFLTHTNAPHWQAYLAAWR
jgi:predicted PolB exonuclease-like 3'-5' exonuclease